MSRFAALKDDIAEKKAPSMVTTTATQAPKESELPVRKTPARIGKKGIAGFFSPELSRALNILAIEEGTTVQALMGEAFDLLMRARGKHAFGER